MGLGSKTTEAITKTTPRKISAYFSNACTRL